MGWGGGRGEGGGSRGRGSRCKQDVVRGDNGERVADGHHGGPGVKFGWVDRSIYILRATGNQNDKEKSCQSVPRNEDDVISFGHGVTSFSACSVAERG